MSSAPTSTTKTKAALQYEHGEFPETERLVRGVRWARTGLFNGKGQPILKRLDLPIGFNADHSQPVYAIEDLD